MSAKPHSVPVAEKLMVWADDVQLSNRVGFPHYANPGELKADIRSLVEQLEALRGAAQEYVRVVNEHAEALADYAEDMDGDAEQIVSSLGFLGHLDRGCLDPDEDALAQALDVLKASFPAKSPEA